MKSTLLLDARYSEAFDKLTDEQLGSLTRALMKYNQDGIMPSFSDKVVDMAFAFIRKDIDATNERHQVRCQRNRENAQKRWAKRKQSRKASTPKQKKGKQGNESSKVSQNTPPVNYDALRVYWNKRVRETGSKMPVISRIDGNRRRLLAARMNEYGDTRYLQAAFEKAFVAPFLNGKNKSNWIANIDWILNSANFSRVLDGNFNPQKAEKTNESRVIPTMRPLSQEELLKERAERAMYDAEKKRFAEERQRANILLAIKAAEENPHSIRANVAYLAYNDGTMSRLGICWTPPINTPCHDTQSRNRQVAQ